MSTEEDKVKHSRRMLQKKSHIKRQMKIAKAYDMKVDEPHTLLKQAIMNCGDPKCYMCGNPRRFFKEPTIQEKRFFQKELIE